MVALATTYAFIVVNMCLVILVIVYGVLGAVGVAWTCHATAAQVRYLIVYLKAR